MKYDFMAAQQWVCNRQWAITSSRPKSLLQLDAGLPPPPCLTQRRCCFQFPRWYPL